VFTFFGYRPDPIAVLQVKLASPKLVVPARSALWALRTRKGAAQQSEEMEEADDEPQPMEEDEEADTLDKGLEAEALRQDPFEIYEAEVLFTLRFMIDKDLRGCGWFQLPRDKMRLVAPQDRQSKCQLELEVHVDDLKSLPDKQDVPREVRLMAFE
jgi:DNA polymerase elongation subunit (family B)